MSADVDQITDGTLTGVEGCLGELSIRKSGTCQLILGDSKQEKNNQRFDIEAGTQVGFLQVGGYKYSKLSLLIYFTVCI